MKPSETVSGIGRSERIRTSGPYVPNVSTDAQTRANPTPTLTGIAQNIPEQRKTTQLFIRKLRVDGLKAWRA